MTRSEFIEKWDNVRADFRSEYQLNYTCNTIRRVFGVYAMLKYCDLLRNCDTQFMNYCSAWKFNYEEDKGNDIRPLALEMFYQTCLSFELYKEF